MRHAQGQPPRPMLSRSAFTLIELIIVVLVLLILMTLTVAIVGDMLNNSRVRSAGRQIQNYLAGARDRAIYSASRVEAGEVPPRVGVRFLSDPALIDPTTSKPRGFTSMVFVQETRPVETKLRVWEDTSVTPSQWHVNQFISDETTPGDPADGNTPIPGIENIQTLIQRGLVNYYYQPDTSNPGDFVVVYYLSLTFNDDNNKKRYYARFLESDITTGTPVGYLQNAVLSAPLPWNPLRDPPLTVEIAARPTPLPNEEPRLLPTGTVIEAQSSLVGSGPMGGTTPTEVDAAGCLQELAANGGFDVMFNAQGVVDGPVGAAGLLHLVITDLEDIEQGFRVIQPKTGDPTKLVVGSPFIDADGTPGWDDADSDGNFDERQGDIRIVSIRTQTGSAMVSDIGPAVSGTGYYIDPFHFAELGGEAR